MTPADRIRARLQQLDAMEKTYKTYAQQRLDEQDWHGLWDVAINLAEVSNERDGLNLAYVAIMAEPEAVAPLVVAEFGGTLPSCTCIPYEGKPDGHDYTCAMVVKARERNWKNIEVKQTPYGCGVYDRRFE